MMRLVEAEAKPKDIVFISGIMDSIKVKLSLYRDGKFVLSEGRARLLKLVEGEGSITLAAKKMKMSYRHAWGVLRAVSDAAGVEIINSSRGGEKGGKTSLTDEGKRLLNEYEARSNELSHFMKDKKAYDRPALTVDGVVALEGKIVLIRRGNEPFKGKYALPGGFVEYGETTEHAVVREVKEETGLETKIVRLLAVRSDPLRDPRGHTVSVVYVLEKTGGKLVGGDDAERACLFTLGALPQMAFDHAAVVELYKASVQAKD